MSGRRWKHKIYKFDIVWNKLPTIKIQGDLFCFFWPIKAKKEKKKITRQGQEISTFSLFFIETQDIQWL